jgi:hypothetical protein
MGTKPGIALISVVLTGITLSGCESCGACGASKLWGNDKATVSAGQSNNLNGYPASWANQPRTLPGSPLAAAGSAVPANQSARITDPGLNSGAMTSSLSNQPAAPTLPTNATDARFPTTSQTPATFPGLPSSGPATGIDQKNNIPNTGNVTAPAQQPAWPAAVGGMGMRTQEPPPVNTAQTRESSYQTRYPELPSSASVPTMPKPGQNPNE